MRRAAASILVTLGLVCAGVAWWAYAASYTVLDSARSERIAETLVEQPVIQDAVAEGLGNALQQALPPGTPISSDRPKVLSRAGRWALRAGAFWFLFGWALPYALTKISEAHLAALGAIGVA